MLRQLRDLAEKHGLTRTVHLAQSRKEVVRAMSRKTPAEYLRDNDWLGPDVVGAHWTFCTDDDIELLTQYGVHMAHCPANSSRRGPHTVGIGRILDAGVNVALGTDNMNSEGNDDAGYGLRPAPVPGRRGRGLDPAAVGRRAQ